MTSPIKKRSLITRVFSALVRGVLPIVVIAAGGYGAMRLIQTAPQAKQRPPARASTLVSVRQLHPGNATIAVEAMGTVIAAREIVLQPQVTGVIQVLHPALVPGGRITAGEEIATIDSADYEVARRQAEASLARAKAQLRSAELEVERVEALRTRQATNKKELDDAQTALAAAEADVAAAEATLEKARLDLTRTVLRAPFSCVVVSESVDVGSLVTPQTQLATLVSTEEYWVRASVPVEQLRWIDLPENGEGKSGSVGTVYQRLGVSVGTEWNARVVRLLGDLEPQGRMARLLLSVPDPLNVAAATGEQLPLLMGAYVDVTITGSGLRDVYTIRRDELHDGDTIWLMDDDDQLNVRRVEIAYHGRDEVYVPGGIEPGARLVTSDLAAPIAGMPLRTGDEPTSATRPARDAGADRRGGARP